MPGVKVRDTLRVKVRLVRRFVGFSVCFVRGRLNVSIECLV